MKVVIFVFWCLSNCSCTAYYSTVDGSGHLTWTRDLIDIQRSLKEVTLYMSGLQLLSDPGRLSPTKVKLLLSSMCKSLKYKRMKSLIDFSLLCVTQSIFFYFLVSSCQTGYRIFFHFFVIIMRYLMFLILKTIHTSREYSTLFDEHRYDDARSSIYNHLSVALLLEESLCIYSDDLIMTLEACRDSSKMILLTQLLPFCSIGNMFDQPTCYDEQ